MSYLFLLQAIPFGSSFSFKTTFFTKKWIFPVLDALTCHVFV